VKLKGSLDIGAGHYTISSEAVPRPKYVKHRVCDDLTEAGEGWEQRRLETSCCWICTPWIPRRMLKVNIILLAGPVKTKDDLQHLRELIDAEQKTLDVDGGSGSMQNTVDITIPMAASRPFWMRWELR